MGYPSNERIFAEGDYHKALTEAHALFCAAFEKAEPVLKAHVKLRMSQISQIVDQDLQAAHDQEYGGKQAG